MIEKRHKTDSVKTASVEAVLERIDDQEIKKQVRTLCPPERSTPMLNIKEYFAAQKEEIKKIVAGYNFPPQIGIFQVGHNPASDAYVKGKMRDMKEVGIPCKHIRFNDNITDELFQDEFYLLSQHNYGSCSFAGVMLQLPLPEGFNTKKALSYIEPIKDIDGLVQGSDAIPATARGIIDYLEANNYDFVDKNVVIIGRSELVGRPLAKLFLDRSANVTVLHSKTSAENRASALCYANIVVVAVGQRNLLRDEDIWQTAPDCVIFDVGINRGEDGHLYGDCESVTKREKTPVPGGVGLLTRLALLRNIIDICGDQMPAELLTGEVE